VGQDHLALELNKDAQHPEHGTTGRRGHIERRRGNLSRCLTGVALPTSTARGGHSTLIIEPRSIALHNRNQH
jgi:hypothetical protein